MSLVALAKRVPIIELIAGWIEQERLDLHPPVFLLRGRGVVTAHILSGQAGTTQLEGKKRCSEPAAGLWDHLAGARMSAL